MIMALGLQKHVIMNFIQEKKNVASFFGTTLNPFETQSTVTKLYWFEQDNGNGPMKSNPQTSKSSNSKILFKGIKSAEYETDYLTQSQVETKVNSLIRCRNSLFFASKPRPRQKISEPVFPLQACYFSFSTESSPREDTKV